MTDTAETEHKQADAVNDSTAARLRSFIERFERLDEEIQGLRADQKDIMAEAKADGFDTKVMRQVIRLRKKDPHARREEEEILDTYLSALGML